MGPLLGTISTCVPRFPVRKFSVSPPPFFSVGFVISRLCCPNFPRQCGGTHFPSCTHCPCFFLSIWDPLLQAHAPSPRVSFLLPGFFDPPRTDDLFFFFVFPGVCYSSLPQVPELGPDLLCPPLAHPFGKVSRRPLPSMPSRVTSPCFTHVSNVAPSFSHPLGTGLPRRKSGLAYSRTLAHDFCCPVLVVFFPTPIFL